MSYLDDLMSSSEPSFNLNFGNPLNFNDLSSVKDDMSSLGGKYDFSDIVRNATAEELFDPANMGWFGASNATADELNDPANKGFYQPSAQPDAEGGYGISGLLNKLLGGVKTLVGAGGSNDISKGLELAALIAALTNKNFGKAEGTDYKGTVPMDMVATRKEYAQAPRKYGEGAKGQKYSDVTYAAEGGIMGLARGGSAKVPRYLEGSTDGMADKIDTDIDGKQRAKLSHGEFVIPADVVSHLGNGNSKAGANELYKMMDRVRKARTGTKKQGKQINAEAFTPGKLPKKAKKAFAEGGSVSQTSGLAPYAGDYITQTLGKANALANAPVPVYTGQLTAGTSPLQGQSFSDFGKLTGSMDDFGTVQSYMNPYINSVMNQQADEARRQAGITQTGINSQATQQNAFGGSRSALMSAENNRNLGTNLANIQSSGLNRAYDNAMNQQVQAGQYGLNALNAKLGAGTAQRGIEQDALTAQQNQFNKTSQAPFDILKWKMSLLGNLPVGSETVTNNTSPYADWLSGFGSAAGILK
jgi:hypothetical protein